MASLNVFVKTMHKIDTTAEVYLELFQTCRIKLFAKIVNSFKKRLLLNLHGSKYASQLQRDYLLLQKG